MNWMYFFCSIFLEMYFYLHQFHLNFLVISCMSLLLTENWAEEKRKNIVKLDVICFFFHDPHLIFSYAHLLLLDVGHSMTVSSLITVIGAFDLNDNDCLELHDTWWELVPGGIVEVFTSWPIHHRHSKYHECWFAFSEEKVIEKRKKWP